ncbi:hypothetical protein [Prescottella defluvii]|uniref:hypothetical protein n=1 Tax=Prescottella defluvii TaxID=1323361 RepID=UPI001E556F05|nr:hypothetical protein [Prescottella defluvii]
MTDCVEAGGCSFACSVLAHPVRASAATAQAATTADRPLRRVREQRPVDLWVMEL